MRIAAAIGLLVFCGAARAQHPLDEEQTRLVEGARAAALEYSSSLPDFLCTERIVRREDPRNDNRWRPLDTLTVRLSYLDHRENYKLMAIDGKPTQLEYLAVGGALTTGEFGSRLIALFTPESKAVFEWKGWAQLHGRRVAVLHYRIGRENSTFLVGEGTGDPKGKNAIVVGYRGEVSIDEETRRVLRLTAMAELPAGFPIRESTSTVEYDFRKVGGKQFLVPVSAVAGMRRGNYKSENHVEFRDYRKFQGESTISFENLDEKVKTLPDKK
jgi:hypothetical protein